jgi:hypothetical protein
MRVTTSLGYSNTLQERETNSLGYFSLSRLGYSYYYQDAAITSDTQLLLYSYSLGCSYYDLSSLGYSYCYQDAAITYCTAIT